MASRIIRPVVTVIGCDSDDEDAWNTLWGLIKNLHDKGAQICLYLVNRERMWIEWKHGTMFKITRQLEVAIAHSFHIIVDLEQNHYEDLICELKKHDLHDHFIEVTQDAGTGDPELFKSLAKEHLYDQWRPNEIRSAVYEGI